MYLKILHLKRCDVLRGGVYLGNTSGFMVTCFMNITF